MEYVQSEVATLDNFSLKTHRYRTRVTPRHVTIILRGLYIAETFLARPMRIGVIIPDRNGWWARNEQKQGDRGANYEF